MACLWTHLEPYGWELHFRMGTRESRDRLSTTMSSQPGRVDEDGQAILILGIQSSSQTQMYPIKEMS